MKGHQIVAVDLGSTKTVALAASSDDRGGMRVDGLVHGPSLGISRGVIEDASGAIESIGSAISQLEKQIGSRIDVITLGVSGPQIQSKISRGLAPIIPAGRALSREDVLQVIRHSRQAPGIAGSEQFFAAPSRFTINGREETTKPIGIPAHKLEVQTTLVYGDAEHIRSMESLIEKLDRSLMQLTPSAFASASGVLGAPSATTLTAVADIGASKTDIAVFDRGAPTALFCCPLGSTHFTNDVAKLLKTSTEEAERLKCDYGAQVENKLSENETVDVTQIGQIHARPLDRKVLSQIISSRVRELARFVREDLTTAGVIGRLTGGIVLTGGGAKLIGIESGFETVFPDTKVHVVSPRTQNVELSDPAMAAVVGLAKIALQSEDDELSPAAGNMDWKQRIRNFKLKLSARA